MVMKHVAVRNPRQIARVALTCRLWSLLCLDRALWRFICEIAYTPAVHFSRPRARLFLLVSDMRDDPKGSEPTKAKALSEPENAKALDFLARAKFHGNFRTMYIYRPHVRCDGVYISTVRYHRPGLSESSFYQPVHSVTYYRYLRFFPNGRVYSLLTADEPPEVVRRLRALRSERPVARIRDLAAG